MHYWGNLPVSQEEPSNAILVLLVEDNPIDVRLIRYALREEQTWNTETVVANDGEKAINYLIEAASDAGKKPDLIILDLNLPKRDGTEVLQLVRSHPDLRLMPVIVLSSSPEDVIRQMVRTAKVEANCYCTKPVGADEFLALGHKLRRCYEKALKEMQTAAG